MNRFIHGIDWNLTESFSPGEWPDGVLDDMDSNLFHNGLFPLREQFGHSMTPSPLPEGHVRQKGTSRHSIQNGTRQSDATDQFIESSADVVAKFLRVAQRIKAIGGIGAYFDTKPSVMIHIDMRPERLLWIRVGGDYIYEPNDPAFFYRELANQLEKLR